MRRALGLSALVLGALVVVVQLQQIRHGGLYFDDWKIAGVAKLSGDPGPLALAGELYEYPGFNQRLLASLYLGLTHGLLGTHAAGHLLVTALMSAALGVAVVALLRELGVGAWHAVAVGALTAVFPFADTTRHWAAAGMAPLSVAVLLAGVALGQAALRRGGRRLGLHAAACGCVLAATLLYEAGLGLLLVAAVLHVRRGGLRRGVVRVALDGASALAGLAVTYAHQTRANQRSDVLDHAADIAEQVPTVLARSLAPLGDPLPTWVPLLAAVVVLGAAWTTGRRAWVAGAALAAATLLAGYLAFLASTGYYVPLQPGQGNRTNAVAALGYAGLVWCVAGALWDLARARLGRAALAVPVAAAGLLLAGYANETRDQGRAWQRATDLQELALDEAERLVPAPAPGTRIALFGVPWTSAPNVPVFNDPGDLSGALQVRLGAAGVSGVPVYAATPVACGTRALSWDGAWSGSGRVELPYGELVVLDAAKARAWRVRTARECRLVLAGVSAAPVVEAAQA